MSCTRLDQSFVCEHIQLRNKTLIISESRHLTDSIETLFSNKGWLAKSMPTRLLFGQGSSSMMDYHCAIFVIDHHFRKHFNGLITEMSAFIKNASAHTAIYLLFEHDDDALFATWLTHVKRSFKSAVDQTCLHHAIQAIICTESRVHQELTPSLVAVNA
ncbi:MAG TPA: hypothetical protein VIO87_00440 [Methylotenera sp.]